jgi:hypothetical protein
MNDEQLHTLARWRAFLDRTLTVNFALADDERYAFIARTCAALWLSWPEASAQERGAAFP